jgi:hypothetical protein
MCEDGVRILPVVTDVEEYRYHKNRARTAWRAGHPVEEIYDRMPKEPKVGRDD